MIQFDGATLAGFIGMALILAAYAYLTMARAANPFLLHGMNLAGAALLVVSLLVYTNLPALLLEATWMAIALAGLAKAARARRNQQ